MSDGNISAVRAGLTVQGYFLWGWGRGVAEGVLVKELWEAVPGIVSNWVKPWGKGRTRAGDKLRVWLRLWTGYSGSRQALWPRAAGSVKQKRHHHTVKVNKRGAVPSIHQHAGLDASQFTGHWELGNSEWSESSWCWEGSHQEPGRLGSRLFQSYVRTEPNGGHSGQRPMSEGQSIFKQTHLS